MLPVKEDIACHICFMIFSSSLADEVGAEWAVQCQNPKQNDL